MKLFEDEKFYGEISLKFDSTKKGEKQQQLEHAIEQGLNESKKKEKKIEVKEIHLTKENAKEFEELLKKITGEDK